MEPRTARRGPPSSGSWLVAAVVLSMGVSAAMGCDCATSKGASAPPENSLLPRGGPAAPQAPPAGAAPRRTTTTTLDDVLTPELVQSYLALQLHRAALDMAERTQATRSSGARCSDPQSPCGRAASLRRSRRFAAAVRSDPGRDGDVPVVLGLVGTGLPSGLPSGPSRSLLAPAASTEPTVPVVKGSADPAHPTTPRTALLPGDLQLTPEEEEALAVLLEGRHHKNGDKPFRTRPAAPRPPTRPANWPPSTASSTPASVASVSGKVGGKTIPSAAAPAAGRPPQRSSTANKDSCCSQRKLVQELERQLTLLRQLNAAHMREDWVRASYPSPYYPYLHNLPVHSARGYEDGPMLVPTYFLPSGWRRRDALLPPPSTWTSGARRPGPALPDPANCDRQAQDDQDADDGDGGHLDDKVQLSEQQRDAADREADDLRGADPHDDVGVDPKIGQPVDFEIRR
ncbi:nascent polypeptide-associated complex subunit alpha, muscle-specific form-like [Thrips palmi]|uniref:Nascent polypeptide-associated complex subunit alpha, muscle-specific form-like n=1 Tax=Thrips palmi TaxID=161013 RepID=A0A6P8ZSV0_THRPL|nr:nascent polypeptide-associated complex subunit alpha, muscle-specific form-like [Thrips palmi]